METRTPGSADGLGKRARSDLGTAPQADPTEPQPNGQRQVWAGQILPLASADLDETRLLWAQPVFEPCGDRVHLPTHHGGVQSPT